MSFVKQTKNSQNGFRRGDEGFALIITLTLMALVVLLMISLTVMTRVETTSASNVLKLNQAQENARMALNVAIGELQRTAGPDQRITAQANIMHDLPRGGDFENPFWTGVWDETGTFLTWLVSGNTNLNPGSGDFHNADDDIDGASVLLVRGNSVMADPVNEPWFLQYYENQTVRAPLVPIEADRIPGFPETDVRTVGRYAYWIGDEGVKADATVYDQTGQIPLSVFEQRLSSFLSAQRSDMHNIYGSDTHDTGESEYYAFQEGRKPQLRSLDLNQLHMAMDPDTTAWSDGDRRDARRLRFHDLTTYSRSLFTSVPDGRLKVDLSARHNGATDYPDEFTNNAFSAGELDDIWDYLSIERNAWELAGLDPADLDDAPGGNWPDYLLPEIAMTDENGDFFPGSHPLITKAKSSFRFYEEDEELYLDAVFVVELWNPYSHAIDMGTDTLLVRFEDLPDVEVGLPPVSSYNAELHDIFGDIDFEIDFGGVWQPGEVKVFAGGEGELLEEFELDDNTWPGAPFTYETEHSMLIPPELNEVAPITVVDIEDSEINVFLFLNDDSAILQHHQDLEFPAELVADIDEEEYQFAFYHALADPEDGTDDTGLLDLLDPRSAVINGADVWRVLEFQPTGETEPEFLRGLFHDDPNDNGPVNFAVFFEIPRMEPHSVATLRHLLLGGLPYTIGNPVAGAYNQAFDQYFFSAVPAVTGIFSGEFPNTPILDNPRIQPIVRNGVYPADSDLTADDLFDPVFSASQLWMKGGFNINSTSVEAWAAVLGGLYGDLIYFDEQATDDSGEWGQNFRGFSRLDQSAGTTFLLDGESGYATPTGDENIEYTGGIRVFDDPDEALNRQVFRDMAEEMVRQVIEYGPFLSVEEFLEPTPAGESPLEAALAYADINEGHEVHSSMYVSQGDIMAAVGSSWNVRSDTFRIRAYGEYINPVTQGREGRAWCEAIVQRMPDTVDPGDDVVEPTQPFGRRFEIVSFRWLNTDDI